MKCFHDIKSDIGRRCQPEGAEEYHRSFIQPLVDRTRETVLKRCQLASPYQEYYVTNSALTLSGAAAWGVTTLLLYPPAATAAPLLLSALTAVILTSQLTNPNTRQLLGSLSLFIKLGVLFVSSLFARSVILLTTSSVRQSYNDASNR